MFRHPRRIYHMAVCLNNCVVVIGGDKINHGAILSSHAVWEYNLYTEEWKEYKIANTLGTPPLAIKNSCGAVLGTTIFMFGGLNERSYMKTNDLWKLSKSKGQFNWTKTYFHHEEKLPSPRYGHRCWEYSEYLWVFGGHAESCPGYLNDHGEFSNGLNNQFLCFNPCNKTWTNPKCFGTVPAPRCAHRTVATKDKVWLFGGMDFIRLHGLDDLFQFKMSTYTWTQIETAGMKPQGRSFSSFTAVSDTQLVLHGGYNVSTGSLNDTWILDLPSQTWRQHTLTMTLHRFGHTGSQSVSKSVIIICGETKNEATDRSYTSTFQLMLEPKSLQQLAMKTIYSRQTVLPWRCLPKKLIAKLGFSNKI